MEYAEIDGRMKELCARPPLSLKRDALAAAAAEIGTRTEASKKLFEEAQAVLPGGLEHMLSHTTPHPVFIRRALGAYLWDADGNRYIDYMFGGGPVVLGHNPPAVGEKVMAVMRDKGWFHGLPDEFETLAARKIVEHMPAVDKVRFFQSGTEACMAALRLARAFTGKNKVIKFRGAYHGWSDQFVTDMWVPYSERFMANGIPAECVANTVLVPCNDPQALEDALKQHAGEVAAVFVEPIGPESGTIPMDENFPAQIRRLCDQYDALMVFDEVVTGFRLHLGGAQAWYGVNPDITVLGKIMSSAFPSSGAVGGRADVVETYRSGIMSGGGPNCFVAGTMAASPITCSAVYYSILELEATRAIEKAADTTDELVRGLNELFDERGLPWFAYNYASVLHVELAGACYVDIRKPDGMADIFQRKTCMTEFQTFLRNHGIMTLMGKGYVTLAHTPQDVQDTLAAFDALVNALDI